MIRKLGIGLIVAAVLLAPAGAVEASGSTTRVTVGTDGTQGNNGGGGVVFRSDGREVVFVSGSGNLIVGDTNAITDIFVHNIASGLTTRVSQATDGSEANCGLPTYSFCAGWPDISGDGRFVVFQSPATNLVPNDTYPLTDVFLRDRDTDDDGIFDQPGAVSTTMVSKNFDPQGPLGESYQPTISEDGGFVAFVSSGWAIVSGDQNNVPDVFVRDTALGVTERVSVNSAGDEANSASGDFWYGNLTISADGRYVAFKSDASNLVPDDTNGTSDVFLRDRQAMITERVSVDSDGGQGNFASGKYGIAMSEDGRFVAFESVASNLDTTDTNGNSDIFLRDRQTGATTLVSRDGSEIQGNGPNYYPSLSASGRFLVFESSSDNLVPGDTNTNCGTGYSNCSDIFAKDLQSGLIERVSVDSNGNQVLDESHFGRVSADGKLYAFNSSAPNLVLGDTNNVADGFVHDIGDTDIDGKWDPFDPCSTSANYTDSDGDLKPDACDAPGTGNVDCSGPVSGVSAVDSLKVLRHNAGLSVAQSEPCTDIGAVIGGGLVQGDVDCSNPHAVNSVDALKILRAVAGLPVSQTLPCTPIIGPPP